MDLDLPDGLTARPLTPDDLDEVVGLLRRSEERFFGESFADRADLASEWASPGADDLATATLGIAEGGRLVAWATAVTGDHGTVVIDQPWCGRGLGTTLTRWTEEVVARRGKETVRQGVPERDTAGAELMVELGYAEDWDGWSLRLDEGDTIAHRELPDGIEVRGFEPADAGAAHEVIEDAFSEWTTRPRATFEEWRAEMLEREGSDIRCHRLAVADDRVVGASIVHDSEDTAWVHQLAVHRDFRGQGIAQELLATSFEASRERGVPRAALVTDARTGALDLYTSLGMKVITTWTVYAKPLSPTGPGATA